MPKPAPDTMMDERVRAVAKICKRIGPILRGQRPEIVGAALAELTSMWLAGHVVPGDPQATASIRASMLTMHAETIERLTEVNSKILGTAAQ